MANNLTMTSPTYGAGKFGNALSGGYGSTSVYPATNVFTIETCFKTSFSGSNTVLFSVDGDFFGVNAQGKLFGFGFGGTTSAASVNDGVFHHVEVSMSASACYIFLDGTPIYTGVSTSFSQGKTLTIATHQNFGFTFNGLIDEFAIWNTTRHTASFTPPTAAYASGLTGMTSLYHFDNNGLDSAIASTAPSTMVAPTASSSNASATVTLTAPSDGGSPITGYTVVSNPAGGVDTNAGTTSLSHAITGLSNGTAYTFTATATNVIGTSAASPASNSVTPASSGNNALTSGTGNVLFSPGNWNIGTSTASTINGGAYFRTVFGGTSCALQFDTSGLVAGFPKLEYRVDGTGPWNTVDLANTVPIIMPAETTAYASHLLELNVRATTRSSRWTLGGLVSLTGIILDASKVLTKPGSRPLTGLVFGDSITEGLKSLSSSEDTVNSSNSMQAYSSVIGSMLGAEIGVIGFSGQGFTSIGNGSVPVFGSTYNLIYSGVNRSFTPSPDFIIINQGTNDGTNNIISAAVSVFNGLIAATPSSTKIIVLRPFNGNQAANLQSAIAGCSNPSRISYVDTTGFFISANSNDGLHPYGWEHMTHIAPLVASAVRPLIVGGSTPIANSVSLVSGRLRRSATGAVIPNGKRLRVS